ncbi:uncharacterized protein [Coffea arabica]|uniref:Integrase catalytic domain-containing protein n=1 Tax=Coffea arabica TaxID=13443 RepID=A0ABM4X7M7_COFAR
MDLHYLHNCHVFIFDGKNNFEAWRSMMKNFFQNIGVWNIVETGYTEPIAGIELSSYAVKELERNRQLDYKAMYYLNTQVQLHVAKKFIHAKSTKEAWTILVNSNRGAANVRKIRLRRQFELAQMKSTESVKDFIGTIKEIVNDMESNGENLEEVRVVEKVLRSLTAKFHIKKMVLEATKGLDNLSLAELEGELLMYEMSLNQQPSDTVEEVLQAKVDHVKGKEEVNYMNTNQRGQNFRGRGQGGRGNFRGRGRGYDLHFKYGEGTISDEKLGLIAKKLVIGLPSVEFPDKKCESCILGKKHRDPFPKGKAWRANRPLELIHSDLCSVEIPSNGGSKYFITFIDDFNRKTWVGTEYLVCDDYLVESGIKHQLTAKYTSQQNGVAERKNRTVMDMVRSMMHSKGIPKSFWVEAVSCAIYVLNKCPARCNFGKTPQEVWTGMKPDISHFKVFGCLAYVHVPDHLRKKLDDKAEKCIFIGYSHETKGYKLFNPDTRKVIVSKDVTFNEHGVWDWSKQDPKTSPKYPSISPIMGSSADKQALEQVMQPHGDPSPSAIQRL